MSSHLGTRSCRPLVGSDPVASVATPNEGSVTLPQDDDDDREGIDLRPNGGIHLRIGGKRIKLRPARLRDYRKLVEAWRDATDELRVLSDTAVAWSNDLQAELSDGDGRLPTPDERAEDAKRGREITDRTDELAVAWWAACVATLADDAHADAEVEAAWMTNVATITEAIEWWRTTPSLSGVR